jgi:hypothetical protein
LGRGADDIQQRVDSAKARKRDVDEGFGCLGTAEVERKRKSFGSRRFDRSATSSSSLALRAANTAAEKSRAKRIAVERPMPWLAPVTIATEFFMACSPWS